MFLRSFRFRPNDIESALANGQFRVAFQPQMRLADRALDGAEAFVRWRHPEFGTIPPGLFLDFLVEQGRMPDLTRQVLEASLAALSGWQSAGLSCGVSVNLSVADLRDPGLCEGVRGALSRHGVAAPHLTLELPQALAYLGPNRRLEERPRRHAPDRRADTVTSRAWAEIQEGVAGLRALGVRIALDGGAEALDMLEMFAPRTFDTVKIGATAIRQLAEGVLGGGETPLSRTRLRFAAAEGITTVAVGIEDARPLRVVTGLGFTTGQGMLVGHPSPADLLPHWSPPGAGAEAQGLVEDAATGESDGEVRAQRPAPRAPAVPPQPAGGAAPRAFGQRQRPTH